MSGHRHPSLTVAAMASALALAAVPVAAYEFPSVERGFKPERAFQVGDVDNIRLFNGGLELTIPIGPTYRVGGLISYGLTLTYTSQLWDYETIHGDSSNNFEDSLRAVPVRGSNAGFGWRLSLGEYWDETSSGPGRCSRCYVGPDGSKHPFYQTLHAGQTDDPDTWYTRDGTYLRLRTVTGGHEIDFPDGRVHEFDGNGTLRRISDPFGNDVTIADTSTGWEIEDSHGRKQQIKMTTAPYYDTTVDEVTLTGFENIPSTFDFVHEDQLVRRSCLDTDETSSTHVEVPLLTAVILPDGSQYSMPVDSYFVEPLGGGAPCTQSVSSAPLEGLLLDITLPTLGRIAWDWTTYEFPVPIDHQDFIPDQLAKTAGVWKRTLFDATGAQEAQWVYDQSLPNGQSATESITRVTSPIGDRTDHYFRVGENVEAIYGLPFSPEESADPNHPDLFRSSKIYDCGPGGTSCVLKRTHYLKYVTDQAWDTGPEFNPRVEASFTRYHDDGGKWAKVERSDFDGYGTYRTTTTSGNLDSGNHHVTTRATDPNLDEWHLGIYESETVSDGTTTYRSDYCFDTGTEAVDGTGFLKRVRRRKAANASGAGDVVVVFQPDSDGNVGAELHYGGDLQAMAAEEDLCALTFSVSPEYRIHHPYSFGTLASSQHHDAAGNPVSFKSLDLTIDKWTGLPSSSRDTASVQTSYLWDTSGRMTWERPTGDAWTRYRYTPANASTGATATLAVDRVQNGVVNPSGSQLLAQSEVDFDGFGRVEKEGRRMPANQWPERRTLYDPLGRRTFVSEWGFANKGTTTDYDFLGRVTKVIPADGVAHAVTFAYTGDRVTTRKVKVGTALTNGVVAENETTTTEIRDRQGRLWKVSEASGPTGGLITTTYGYDPAGRLTSVSTPGSGTTQNRTFSYDGRGHLLAEIHPEQTVWTTYKNDSRGHVRKKTQGGTCLDYFYRPFERIERVETCAGTLLKSFSYGNGSDPAQHGSYNGKLRVAERYQRFRLTPTGADWNVRVREVYTYKGLGGRVSQRDTRNFIKSPSASDYGLSDMFRQTFSWNQLGDPSQVDYPIRCTKLDAAKTGCEGPWDLGRTVTPVYDRGWLSAVSGYTGTVPGQAVGTGITYHPSGAPHRIAHGNGVLVTHAADPNGMGRPLSIATTGVAGGSSWQTGDYRYDGAGNVVHIGGSRFTYDHVSRLKSALVTDGLQPIGQIFADGFESGDTSAWGQSGAPPGATFNQGFSYDAFGNLTNVGGSPGRSIPIQSATNRLNCNLSPCAYDQRGNLTQWNNSNFYGYDELGRFNRFTSATEDYIHIYTADDHRLWTFEVSSSRPDLVNRWSLRDLGGKVLREDVLNRSTEQWTTERDYVYRGTGALLAAETPQGRRYMHLDHLGTPRQVTNASAQQVAFHAYSPFGEEITAPAQTTERLKFTAHQRDLGNLAGTGDDLDHMMARQYNPQLGRMLSPDPVPPMRAAMRKAQFWNLYSYTANNPINFIDPDGLFIELPGCSGFTADKGCPELDLIKATLNAAGANDLAGALELETVDGVTRIAAIDAGLIDASNSTAGLIGGLINDQQNTVSFALTTSPVGSGGAAARPMGATRVEITMNLAEVRQTLVNAKPLSGRFAGQRVLGVMTPGPALVHEFGHARPHFQGFGIDAFAWDRSKTENFMRALEYENMHRGLLKGHEHFERIGHGSYSP